MEDKTALSETETVSPFISSLEENVETFMDARVVVNQSEVNSINTQTRSQNLIGTQILYIDLSCINEPVALDVIKTPRQILNLVQTTGAEISLKDDGCYTHTLTLSEEESLSALESLILESKRYLYGKGFTENEIQAMLKENKVDESALIPFVLSLTEEEERQQRDSINDLSPTTRVVDWDRAGRCAIHALGFDALAGFAQSTAKTWSKAVLKAVFKTVASKMMGPVGVAIAVIDFSLCYWG